MMGVFGVFAMTQILLGSRRHRCTASRGARMHGIIKRMLSDGRFPGVRSPFGRREGRFLCMSRMMSILTDETRRFRPRERNAHPPRRIGGKPPSNNMFLVKNTPYRGKKQWIGEKNRAGLFSYPTRSECVPAFRGRLLASVIDKTDDRWYESIRKRHDFFKTRGQ